MTSGLEAAPLSGVAVVEHCAGVAGSYMGAILGSLGADVFKVEDIQANEPDLRYQEPLVSVAPPMGALFTFLNGGKSSATVDLRTRSGQNLFHELVASSEVLLDDTSVSLRRERGLAPAAIGEVAPNTLYVSILPFGIEGHKGDVPAHAVNVFNASGEGYLLPNGMSYEAFPDRAPISIYGDAPHLQAAAGGVVAVLAALFSPVPGQILDLSEQDLNVALAGMNLQRLGDGVLETREVRSYAYGGVLECRNGFVELLLLEQQQWEGLVQALGRPSWATKPEFGDPADRALHGRFINEHLRFWASDLTTEEVMTLLKDAGLPVGVYHSPDVVLELHHETERCFFEAVEIGSTTAQVPTLPFRFLPDQTPLGRGNPPPYRGSANEAVYRDRLGKTQQEFEEFVANGII